MIKYTTQVFIDLPRMEVIRLFDSTVNMYKWQPGLKSFEVLSGDAGQEGCRSRMVYKSRKDDLIMTETITKRNFPDEFHTTYQAKGVYNEIFNYFSEPGENKTQWQTISIFRFSGLMAFMAPFMKTAFKQNTILMMERFKIFAEAGDPG